MTPSVLFSLGFVFMFTIGGLLNHLAFRLNTTVCWKVLTIMLLSLVKMYNFEQSAGNLEIYYNILVGSSETIRSGRNMARYSP